MSDDKQQKNKMHTSNEVKMRYNKKTYSQINLPVRKEVAEKYKAKCKDRGIPYTKLLHEAIEKFLEED